MEVGWTDGVRAEDRAVEVGWTDGVRAEDRAVEAGWDGVCEPRTVAVGVMCM